MALACGSYDLPPHDQLPLLSSFMESGSMQRIAQGSAWLSLFHQNPIGPPPHTAASPFPNNACFHLHPLSSILFIYLDDQQLLLILTSMWSSFSIFAFRINFNSNKFHLGVRADFHKRIVPNYEINNIRRYIFAKKTNIGKY